jgi:ABC-type transport system substrate-binding protein
VSTSAARSRNCGAVTGADGRVAPRWLAAALLLALLPSGIACVGDGFDREDREARTVRVATPGRVLALAPELTWSYYPAQAASYVFEGLTRTEEDGTLVPALARTWIASPDGRHYRLVMRTGVRFHDGTRFTAHDVVRAWSASLHISPDSLTHPWMLDGIDGALEFSLCGSSTIRPSTSTWWNRSPSSRPCSPTHRR